MKISYNKEIDALSITFQETTITTQHLAEGVAVDYDQNGHLAGIEILDASQQFGGMETNQPNEKAIAYFPISRLSMAIAPGSS